MNKRQKTRLITSIGIAAIGIIVSLMIISQIQFSEQVQNELQQRQHFITLYERYIKESRDLTASYQDEVAKWQKKEYTADKMISISDNYFPKFESLISRLSEEDVPSKFNEVIDLTVKSLTSELQSYKYFQNYLKSGDPEDDQKSTDLLSESLRYEDQAFASLNSL